MKHLLTQQLFILLFHLIFFNMKHYCMKIKCPKKKSVPLY